MGAAISGSTWEEVAGRVWNEPRVAAAGTPPPRRPWWRRALCALGFHPIEDLVALAPSPDRDTWSATCLSCDRVLAWRDLSAVAKLRLYREQVVVLLERLRDGLIDPGAARALVRRRQIPAEWREFRSILGPEVELSELAEGEVVVANAPHGWTVLRRETCDLAHLWAADLNNFEACIRDALRSGRIPELGRRHRR